MAPRRRMDKFGMTEISAVVLPAQEGAKVAIIKSADGAPIEKRMWLSDEVDGHQHVVNEYGYDGTLLEGGDTSWAKGPDDEYGHSHPWVRDPESGKISIGASDGHSHKVKGSTAWKAADPAQIAQENAAMPPIDEKTLKAAQDEATANKAAADAAIAKAAELTAQNAVLAKEATMGDASRAYYTALPAADKAAYRDMDEKDRKKKADDAAAAKSATDPVVYTGSDGQIYKSSDDPRMIANAKRLDEEIAKGNAARDMAANAIYKARVATELQNVAGEEVAKIALLKAVDSIGDEATRTAVKGVLAAANSGLVAALTRKGHSGTVIPASGSQGPAAPFAKTGKAGAADDALTTMAKEYAAKNAVPFGKAYETVIGSEEGKALYEDYVTGVN